MELGKRIPEETSELLKALLSTKDMHDVAENDPNLTYPTVRAIIYRDRSITESSYTIIYNLIKRAFENIEEKTTFLEKSKSKLEILQNGYNVFSRSIEKKVAV